MRWATLAAALVGVAATSLAAPPRVHYRHRGDMSPGAIGRWQLRRGGPLPGYFQPVVFTAPVGVQVAPAGAVGFSDAEPAPFRVALQVGHVYRLRVVGIPLAPGEEVFPTVELIDRLYPPKGFEARFPVPVELTREDLELALEGNFITRVIYVEDPDRALPVNSEPGRPQWFEAPPGHDPLQLADNMGRPIAILRMGGRVPLESGAEDPVFRRPSPPWLKLLEPGEPHAMVPTD